MKIAMFQTHTYERQIFEEVFQQANLKLTTIEPRLTAQTAALAEGHDGVISFVNDVVDAQTLGILKKHGVKVLALRCAGFNHVDIVAAAQQEIPIVRVPAYSPHAVAEHTVCLLLALNRKIHRAFMRVHSLNFSLEGLVGFDLHGKTVGVIGTGKIGAGFAKIMAGFGCQVLAYDLQPDLNLANVCQYEDLETVFQESDVISLHVPLTPQTHHLVDERKLSLAKKGVILLNTSRGALVDTKALIAGLKSGHIGGAGLDVYEEEEGIFFEDLSDTVLQDDLLARLLTFPNTIITAHQAFLTKEALWEIARTTADNLSRYLKAGELQNHVTTAMVAPA